jgi:PfaD family protein
LTAAEAALAARVPVAADITVEADSGGHTDNRPLGALFPVMLSLRDEVEAELGLPGVIRVGAAGGLGTPSSVAAAFALGAAYVLTGTVNQCAIESGLSNEGKRMLAQADIADVAMAASADMFELGIRVQVLKRGTLFAARANRLYELYREYESLEALPAEVRSELEARVLGAPLETVWKETEAFWRARDPRQLEQAAADPKHRMALAFRWYLGQSSRWAIAGESARSADFQIWCGPAMGAFNAWVRGSFLEPPEARSVVQIALNLLEGAAVVTRTQQLRTCGVPVPSGAYRFRPRRLSVDSGTR